MYITKTIKTLIYIYRYIQFTLTYILYCTEAERWLMQCREDEYTIKKSCKNCNRIYAKYIPAVWINGNTSSKAVNQIFESINFRFICNDSLTDTVSDEHYVRVIQTAPISIIVIYVILKRYWLNIVVTFMI